MCRSLIKCMDRHGIASWAQVSGHSWPIRQVVSYISQWRSYAFCCLELKSRKLGFESCVYLSLCSWDSHYSLLKVCIISHYGMKHINLDLIGYWTPLWSAFMLLGPSSLQWISYSFWAYYSRKLRWSHIYDNHILLSTNLIFLVNVKTMFTHVPINVKTVKGSWKMKMTCSLSWFLMWYQRYIFTLNFCF